MRRIKVRNISLSDIGKQVTICGWIKTVRRLKKFAFVEVNDGSTVSSIQVVLMAALYEHLGSRLTTGASVRIEGLLIESRGVEQLWEIQATDLEIVGDCPVESYPLQKKGHSFEFLRSIAHLRMRTQTQNCVARIRNTLAFATHEFFQQRGFIYVQTPILTSIDCEGSGEQFRVTTLPLDRVPKLNGNSVDFSKDFFHKPAYLTVSGQLEGEALALGLSDVYVFGPTFRAENSNTSRHLAEFWMIEPEMVFADLRDNMECSEAYLKHLARSVLERCEKELEFLKEKIEEGLLDRLTRLTQFSTVHLTYTEAVELLKKSGKLFEFPVDWGVDLQSEHERYLTEEYCNGPIILTDYPSSIKPFYMRLNSDGKTVAAMDLLVPKIGEIMGGSQREERYEILKQRMIDSGLNLIEYDWYLQLREYGGVPHSGFGAGFERLVQLMTGMENIRDVIPFPRYPGRLDF